MKFLVLLVTLVALASAGNRGARLRKGECIGFGDKMISDKNCFHMLVQEDGNMVIYRNSDRAVAWASKTDHRGGYRACMQEDGNFVLRDVNVRPLWAPGTDHKGGHFVYLQDDGQLSIRGANERAVWVSGRVMNC